MESWRVDGRVAIVTGAQRGIGYACADALLAAGAAVACVDLPGPTLDEGVARLGEMASAHPTDLSDVEGFDGLVNAVVEQHDGLDILVYAAGVLGAQSFLDMDAATWDRTLGVNTRAAAFLAQACARSFVDRSVQGRIVMFASIGGGNIVRLNNTAYSASKSGLIQAARCMALELAPYGITVNTISPGSTATEMLGDQVRGDFESVIKGDASQWRLGIPLGRLADPSDQASLALFLAGDGARHITGQDLTVDGGQTIV